MPSATRQIATSPRPVWPSRAVLPILAVLIAGCAHSPPTTQPSSVTERQNAALHDPFGYGSDMQKSDMRVSGDGDYDQKKMNRDLHDVFNP